MSSASWSRLGVSEEIFLCKSPSVLSAANCCVSTQFRRRDPAELAGKPQPDSGACPNSAKADILYFIPFQWPYCPSIATEFRKVTTRRSIVLTQSDLSYWYILFTRLSIVYHSLTLNGMHYDIVRCHFHFISWNWPHFNLLVRALESQETNDFIL